VHDTSRPPDRIRQDVSRSPGGDSRIFLNNCIGCHSGMDPLARAFAYYDFDNGTAMAPGTMRLVYTDGTVQPKYFNNNTNFAPGFITPNDAWENRWRKGQNKLLDWSGSLPGSGAERRVLDAAAAAELGLEGPDPAEREDLPFRVELWNEARTAVEQVLAVTASGGIGYAAFYAATRELPERYITLRHKHRIVSRWNGPGH